MKQEAANTQGLRALTNEKSFLRRLFDSVFAELHALQSAYTFESIDQRQVIARLKQITAELEALSQGGDVHRILSRAEAVILSRVYDDIKREHPSEPEIRPKPAMHDGACADTEAEGGLGCHFDRSERSERSGEISHANGEQPRATQDMSQCDGEISRLRPSASARNDKGGGAAAQGGLAGS